MIYIISKSNMSIENGVNLLYSNDIVYSNLNEFGTNDNRINQQGQCKSEYFNGRSDIIIKSDTETTDEQCVSNASHQNTVITPIYRFKFTKDFMDELYQFSKIHQYDDRKDFKEAWSEWLEDNSDMIEEETERIVNLGFQGDVLDKMFKSARYYFRKKGTEPKEPVQRRKYISIDKSLLTLMDEHIEENLGTAGFQPKTGYQEFCEKNEELIDRIYQNYVINGLNDKDLINDKIKKTYKNRYFISTLK